MNEHSLDDISINHALQLFQYGKSKEFLQSIPISFTIAFPVGSKQILQKCPSIPPETVLILGYTFGRIEIVNRGLVRELYILDYKIIVKFEDGRIWFVDPKIYFPVIWNKTI